jgi:transcriptional regulator with XRE-family HTH domain
MENLEKKLRYQVGQRLKEIREAKHLTREQASQQMQYDKTTIGKIENGDYSITLDSLERFTEFYGLDLKLTKKRNEQIKSCKGY